MMNLMTSIQSLGEVAKSLKDDELTSGLRLLYQRVQQPEAFVSVVGETSTGKSSLVNALLKSEVLPIGAPPTTGALVQICCKTDGADCMKAIYQDATQLELDPAAFLAHCHKGSKDLLKLQLFTARAGVEYAGFNLFDTPGYNAIDRRHEEILHSILSEADVLVLTAGYRSGFGQRDQDLYEDIRAILDEDISLPAFLVINRVPAHITMDDKRIREIISNAEDSLKRTVPVILVRSINREDNATISLPETGDLWPTVHAAATSPERFAAVYTKLGARLLELCTEMLDRVLILISTVDANVECLNDLVQGLTDGLDASYEAIDQSMVHLQKLLSVQIDNAVKGVRVELESIIDDSEKWLEQSSCQNYIQEHALPFRIKTVCAKIEEVIYHELDALNKQLEDIANTTVQKVQIVVSVKDSVSAELADRLAASLAKRLVAGAASAGFRGIGGVGGVAAGAGNFVKMAVKRVGNVFRKTFSKEVYNQIGRTFTKRMVQVIGAAFAAAIEGLVYVYETHVWKKRLKKCVNKAIDEWHEDLKKMLMEDHIPQIKSANRNTVEVLYKDMLKDLDQSKDPEEMVDLTVLEKAKVQLIAVQELLQKESNEQAE